MRRCGPGARVSARCPEALRGSQGRLLSARRALGHVHRLIGKACGFLFGFLLVLSLARAEGTISDVHLDPERLVVIRPRLLDDAVLRVGLHPLLDVLLQERLVILGVPILQDLVDLRDEHHVHELFGSGEPGIQVVGADDCLEAVGEDGLLRPAARVLFPFADKDEVVDAQPARDL